MERDSRRAVDQARDIVNAWANPILLVVIGFFATYSLHGIQNSLEALQTSQTANNDRLARIETHLTSTDAMTVDSKERAGRLESEMRQLDERVTTLEAIHRMQPRP